MFIFIFHNIFFMTYYVNISVIDTLIHVGRIKMLHKHTHLPFLCSQHVVTGHWDWIVFDLHAQKYLNWLRSSDSNLVTKFLSSLVQVMACHKVGASHCLNQWWYIVNLNLRNKLMWPSDAIWRKGCWSTLVQVIACYLTAPSHYLNQC